jgi:hypothetical protein
MPYHTVVVGYDGSGDADRAVEAAADQVGPDGTVHVVTAFHPEPDNRLVEHLRQLPEEFRYVYDEDAVEKQRQQAALAMLQERGVGLRGPRRARRSRRCDPRRRTTRRSRPGRRRQPRPRRDEAVPPRQCLGSSRRARPHECADRPGQRRHSDRLTGHGRRGTCRRALHRPARARSPCPILGDAVRAR